MRGREGREMVREMEREMVRERVAIILGNLIFLYDLAELERDCY